MSSLEESARILEISEKPKIIQTLQLKPFRKNKEYQELESRLQNIFGGEVPLFMIVDELELKLREPDNPHPINAKILTYEDAAEWERYKAIGTADECETAMNVMKQKA